ncbi:MAG TPA: cytochrome b5 domain-containing protein [Propionicimonas sp.]|jgi:cytochrome b involved in lipid metabolism|uniref:cytochrome b5 domain-containing protein n=1 Tax=Propionicimonas sp. TaxID=1955623 RepID=UPI002F41BCBB
MSILKSALVRAILIPVAVALSLTACSAQTPPVAQSAAVAGTTIAADSGTGVVTTLAVKKYTMATVKKHHTKSNCWSVVGKNVYKLTSFIKKHPGGQKRIIAMCGKNATSKFRGQHGTGGRANATLKKYKIGVLA